MLKDIKYIKLALKEARKGLGITRPNPAVGAVIVKNGETIAKAYHKGKGLDHAEAAALKKAGEKSRGATMYVTLEPCNHYGKTPPCSEAIITAGIKRVVYGFADPNPGVKGGGAERLKQAGIKTVTGLMQSEFDKFYRPYKKFVTTGLPFITLKTALTLDGKIAASTGDAKWISCEKSRNEVQKMRASSDAILTGIGTVLFDNPRLNVRIKTSPKKNPYRVVLDSALKIPKKSVLVETARETPTLIFTTAKANKDKIEALSEKGVTIELASEKNSRVNLRDVLKRLGKIGMMNVLVETGPTLAGELLRNGLIDEFCFFISPRLTMGGDGLPVFGGEGVKKMSDALQLKIESAKRSGSDIMVIARPDK